MHGLIHMLAISVLQMCRYECFTRCWETEAKDTAHMKRTFMCHEMRVSKYCSVTSVRWVVIRAK